MKSAGYNSKSLGGKLMPREYKVFLYLLKNYIQTSHPDMNFESVFSLPIEEFYSLLEDFVSTFIAQIQKDAQKTNPDRETLEDEDILATDIELENDEEIIPYCRDIIIDALIHMYLFPSIEGAKMIVKIENTDFLDTVTGFLNDIPFAARIIAHYYGYLYEKERLNISSNQVKKLYYSHPIFATLETHRGYTTITDLARTILWDIYDDLKNDYTDKDIFQKIDSFLCDNSMGLSYFAHIGIDVSDESMVATIKRYMVNAILADAYVSLKLDDYDKAATYDPELFAGLEFFDAEERQALSILENAERVALPQDKHVRYEIYYRFFEYLENVPAEIRRKNLAIIEENGDSPKVLKLNPLSQLE